MMQPYSARVACVMQAASPVHHHHDPEGLMTDQSYTTSFTVDRPAGEVFEAINDVRSWWNEDLTGETDSVGAQFVHEVKGIHLRQH